MAWASGLWDDEGGQSLEVMKEVGGVFVRTARLGVVALTLMGALGCATAKATVDSGEELHVKGASRERCVSWLTGERPDPLRWFVLMDELAAEPPGVRAQTLERIAYPLESWPDRMRRMPEHWSPGDLGTSERAAQSSLVRHLDMRVMRDKAWREWDFSGVPAGVTTITLSSRRQAFALIAAHERGEPGLAALRALDFSRASVHPDVFTALAGSSLAGALRELSIATSSPLASLEMLLSEEGGLTALERLRVRGVLFEGDNVAGSRRLIDALLAWERLPELDELGLSFVLLYDEGVERLAGSGALARLERLSLDRVGMKRAGAIALAKAPMPRLRALDVSFNPLGDEGLEALSRPAAMGGVRELGLRGVGATDASASWLGSAAAFARVESLAISGNRLTAEGVWQILGRGTFAALERLDVSNNPLGERGLWSVVGSPHFARLKSLRASSTRATDLGVAAFSGAPSGALERVHLAQNGLTGRSAAVIASSAMARNLRVLDMHRNALGDEGARALAASPGFWRELRLSQADIGDEGIVALLGSESMRLVERVDLSDNVWSHAGALALGKARVMERLIDLDVDGNALGPPTNLVEMSWSPSALHLSRFDLSWGMIEVPVDTSESVEDMEAASAIALGLVEVPGLVDRAIQSPYLSAPMRRRIQVFVARALKEMSDEEVEEAVPEALLVLARSYMRDLQRKNAEWLASPLFGGSP